MIILDFGRILSGGRVGFKFHVNQCFTMVLVRTVEPLCRCWNVLCYLLGFQPDYY